MEHKNRPLAKFVFAFALFTLMYKGFKAVIKKIDKRVEENESD